MHVKPLWRRGFLHCGGCARELTNNTEFDRESHSSLRPVLEPQPRNPPEIAVIVGYERGPMDQRVCCDPKVMVRDHFSAPRELGLDGAESFSHRRSEGQKFYPREESPVAAEISLHLARSGRSPTRASECQQGQRTATRRLSLDERKH